MDGDRNGALSQPRPFYQVGVWALHGLNIGNTPGRSQGLGCVVGAGSVVTKTFPAFSVIAGVPARLVRSRLEPEPSAQGTVSP